MGDRPGFHRKRRSGVVLTLGPNEVELLDHLLGQLVDLIAPSGADARTAESEDPLAAMVGIGTSTETPTDLALARLLPDAYGDDPDLSAEFRRYTEMSLRERKQATAERARALLTDPSREALTDEGCSTFLLALNDLRLVIGSRLEVTDDPAAQAAAIEALAPDDPRLATFEVYEWLGYLQWTLLSALDG